MREELAKSREQLSASAGAPASAAAASGGYSADDGQEDYAAEFEHQQQLRMLGEQDEALDSVFHTVGNLRAQADTMGRELEEQVGMLEEVEQLTDRVGGKLQTGIKKVGTVLRRNEDGLSSCCIGVLIVVLIILLILVLVI
jgi:t-SNARE syntaxin family protein